MAKAGKEKKLDINLLNAVLSAKPKRTLTNAAAVLGYNDLPALLKALANDGYRIVSDRRIEKINAD